MTGQFSEDDKERVRQATDIVDLVSQYVSLRQTGKSFKGLCPFHDDKNPSFVVSPDRQTYYCFACHEGGDAFAFVMAQEKLDFPAALELLARRAGITLKRRKRSEGEAPFDRDRLYDANAWAAEYFGKMLQSDAGRGVRAYLEKRGFKDAIIAEWQLGFAPDSWDDLLKAAQKAGFKTLELENAGLIIPREGKEGHYDRFRNRLMFPIFDTQDRAVGFGARALKDEDQPKYLNSPETPLFSKSRALYGLNKAKKAVSDAGNVAIVEGYTDVLMAHQCGVPIVVATLGTALTREHARLLKRFTPHVTVVFDADAAGQKASDRSLDIFVEEAMQVSVVELPAGEDPCDTMLNRGADTFRSCLEKGEELFSYKVALARRSSGDTPAEQAAAIDRVLETLARVPNGVERSMVFDRVVRLVQERFAVNDEGALRQRLSHRMRQMRTRPTDESGPPDQSGQPSLTLPAMERELLAIGLGCPELVPKIAAAVKPPDCRDPRAGRILEAMIALERSGKAADEAHLTSALEDRELGRLIVEIAALDPGKEPYEARLEKCLRRWREQGQRASAHSLREKLKAAAAAGDAEAERKLWEDIRHLERGDVAPS